MSVWLPYLGSFTPDLSGEHPGGITTNEGVPVSADIRVISREFDGFIGDGNIASKTTSNEDGTWFAGGLQYGKDLRCRRQA